MASTSTGRTGKKYSTEEVLAELFADSDSGGEDFGNSDSDVDISVPDVEENESSGEETVVQTKTKRIKKTKAMTDEEHEKKEGWTKEDKKPTVPDFCGQRG